MKKHGVRGFKFAARSAGIKKSGKLDLALIYSEVPARCAGVFTTNRVVAAPVLISRPRAQQGMAQAVIVNSGNANACTGEKGMADAQRCSELTAHALGIPEELVQIASTGVIGMPLPLDRFERHIPQLPAMLVADGADHVAEAIMTTDAFSKVAMAEGNSGDANYRILGLAKGAGMIHPNMATMLGFVMTDAAVAPELLAAALPIAVEQSFNSITVDGDTSTNDMVLLLANGMSEGAEIRPGSTEADLFQQQLNAVLLDLAKMIVRDGEGSTKLVKIQVTGALSCADARLVARSVATSSLVKTAFFGQDANWGRIIAAAGYSGAELNPDLIEIRFDEVSVVSAGISTGKELEDQATEVLKKPEFCVHIDLGLGEGASHYYTSDLTYDYVKINADYRS